MDVKKILSEAAIFVELPESSLEQLAGIAKEIQVDAGTELVREGRRGNAMYLVVDGQVEVTKRNQLGSTERIALLEAGAHFGEMALVTHTAKRTANVVTVSKTTLIELSARKIETLCDGDSQFGRHFFRALARSLARRLSHATMAVANFRSLWNESEISEIAT